MIKTKNINVKRKGFTIIEIAIVITIISIISASLLVFSNNKMQEAGRNLTREKMILLEKAIQAYVKQYGSLPCPADITLTTSNSYYGFGPTQASGCGSSGATQLNSSRAYSGMVPFKTINPSLPASISVDAWGNRIVYIMDERYASSANSSGFGSSNTFTSTNSSNTDLIIRAQSSGGNVVEGNGSNNPSNSSKVAYILLSYGPNGFYGRADKNPGTTNPNSSNSNEQENALNNQTFVQRLTDQNFDDILRFKTRWQLE